MQKSSPIRFAEIEFDTYTFSLSLTAPGFDRVGRYGRFPPVMVFSPPSSLLPLPDSFFAFSHDRGISPPPVCADAGPLSGDHPFPGAVKCPSSKTELGLLFCREPRRANWSKILPVVTRVKHVWSGCGGICDISFGRRVAADKLVEDSASRYASETRMVRLRRYL